MPRLDSKLEIALLLIHTEVRNKEWRDGLLVYKGWASQGNVNHIGMPSVSFRTYSSKDAQAL